MLQLLYLGLGGLFSLTLSKYQKTAKKVLLFFIILYLIILMCFSYTNNDTYIYKTIIYEGFKNSFFTKDLGFGILLQLSHKLGLTYEVFRFILYFISIILLHLVASKLLKKHEIIFWLLYILYPMFYDNIETRNFLGYVLFLFALPLLFDEKTKKKVLFVILFICAGLLHKIIFIYSIPLFMYLFIKPEKKITRTIIDFLFVLLCLIGMNKNLFVTILNSMPQWLQDIPGIGRNLETTNTNGWIVNLAITVSFYVSIRFMYVKIIDLVNKGKVSSTSLTYKFCKMVYILGAFGSVLVPFYIISGDFMRVTRNLYAFEAIALLIVFENCDLKFFELNLLSGSLFMLIIAELIGIASVFYSHNQSAIIYDIFVNNYCFNLGKLRYTWEERPWSH